MNLPWFLNIYIICIRKDLEETFQNVKRSYKLWPVNWKANVKCHLLPAISTLGINLLLQLDK